MLNFVLGINVLRLKLWYNSCHRTSRYSRLGYADLRTLGTLLNRCFLLTSGELFVGRKVDGKLTFKDS